MQSDIESLDGLQRRLKLSIPKDKIEEGVNARLKRLAKKMKVHGFRPGKVPLKIVAQQYGTQLEQEVLSDALNNSFYEVMQAQDVRVAGYPQFENQTVDGDDAEYVFNVVFEVYPEIEVGDLSEINIEQPIVQINAGDIDKTIEVLQKQHTTYEPASRSVKTGDQVDIDFRGTINGEEFDGGSGKNALVIIGEGKLMASFEESIIGMSKGENKSFEVAFPDDYHNKAIAGKTVIFEVTLNKIEAPQKPEIDEQFAKNIGIETGDLAEMRNEIQLNLEKEANKRTRKRIKDQVMQSLLDVTKFEAPVVLIEEEKKRLIQDARRNFETRGMKFNDEIIKPELFQNKAEYRIKLGLIVSEIIKSHNLQAKPEQVRKFIEDTAQGYEDPEKIVKWHYSSPDNLKEIEAIVLEDNVVAWVLDQAKIVDKSLTFEQLMESA